MRTGGPSNKSFSMNGKSKGYKDNTNTKHDRSHQNSEEEAPKKILTKDDTNSTSNSKGTTQKKYHLPRYWKLSTWHFIILRLVIQPLKKTWPFINQTSPIEGISNTPQLDVHELEQSGKDTLHLPTSLEIDKYENIVAPIDFLKWGDEEYDNYLKLKKYSLLNIMINNDIDIVMVEIDTINLIPLEYEEAIFS